MERTRPEACLSDFALDRALDGPSAEEGAHLSGCEACRGRLEAYRSNRAAPLPPLARPTRFYSYGRWLALAAGLVLFVAVGRALDPGTRTKGGPSIGFYVKHGDEVRRGMDGEAVLPGDQLRFTYSVSHPTYFWLVGLDSTGKVTRYFPTHGVSSAKVEPGREIALDQAIELDRTPGAERFFGVFSASPLELPASFDPQALPGATVVELRVEKP